MPTATSLSSKDRLISGSRLAVRIAILMNRAFFCGLILLLIATFVLSTRFPPILLTHVAPADLASALTGMRLLMLIGLAEAIGTEILLRTLAQIIATTRAGDPFIAANARRLQTIGWALLGLQLLDIPGALLARFFPALGSAAPDVSFSPGGWLAVAMVFILARVFAAGSTMRDELEGTV